jgi:hypothetical protein
VRQVIVTLRRHVSHCTRDGSRMECLVR